MAKVESTKYFCDTCQAEMEPPTSLKIQVIFTTEQTEGRSCEPYLSDQKLDLCPDCYKYVLKGHYIFAYGAQGINNYYFTK